MLDKRILIENTQYKKTPPVHETMLTYVENS
jgi:hypothetical protein